MSILQISKLQQRSGNLVDLPQLDEGEFGWASDNNRLFIGKTSPNQNVEVLTAYSNIAFSQIDGSIGNLNMNPVTIAAGEILAYDGTNWVNSGGNAGGNINLGNISNVSISGGAIGYILQTDGLGNLSWTPKGTLLAFIENVTQANPGVVTTTSNHNLTKGAAVTITGSQGMTQLNGNSYYANVLTPTTFALYTDAAASSSTLNTSSYNAYAYTTVSNTTTSVNTVTVGNSAVLSVNKPVQFVGNMSTSGILNNTTYYINSIPTGTTITISSNVYPNGTAGPVLALQTANGLSASVYETGGQITSLVGGGSGGTVAAGTNTQVQFNDAGILGSASTFTFDFANNILTVNGNANVGNLNSTAVVSAVSFASNIANGTAPLTVNSSTKVANLNADLVDGYNPTITIAANTIVVRDTNGNIYGNLHSGTTLTISGNANVGNLGTNILIATGNISGANITGNHFGNGAALSSITGANVSGPVTYATTANSVAGSNVSGPVAYATIANSVAGSNVSGPVANATYATSAGSATTATTAGSATTAGTITTSSQPNLTTATNLTSIGILTTLSVTGNVSVGNVSATSHHIFSVAGAVSAAGSTQGTATALTNDFNVVSTVSSGANGVSLPTAVAGYRITILNTSANILNVYPLGNGIINSQSANVAYAQPAGSRLDFICTTNATAPGGQWYTLNATYD